MTDNGKGSNSRPMVIKKATFYDNFDNTYPTKIQKTTEETDKEPPVDRSELEWAELYFKELASGMFWEWYPSLSGVWLKDKDMWISRKQFQENV